jgi:hypothetical protein
MSQTATITFDLTDPDAKVQFYLAANAASMYSVLWDFEQYLREQVKYHDDGTRDDTYAIRDKFYSIMSEHGINLDH